MAFHPNDLGFYAMAAAAFVLNVAAIVAVVRTRARSTPLLYTLVMLVTWMLYQIAYRVFTDRKTSPDASPWLPPCGFCPHSLDFDPGENSRICTGFIGSVERWMVLQWKFPWRGGNTTVAMGAAVERTLMGEEVVWWPTFALCVLGFAIGPFADVIRVMIWVMQQRVQRHFRRWA